MIEKRRSPRRMDDCQPCSYDEVIRNMNDLILKIDEQVKNMPELLSAKVDKRIDEKIQMFIGGQAMLILSVVGTVFYAVYEFLTSKH